MPFSNKKPVKIVSKEPPANVPIAVDDPLESALIARRNFIGGLAVASLFPSIAAAVPATGEPTGDSSNKPIIVFDVNETLLDFTVLTPVFVRVFGHASVLREWFNQVVLYSEAMSLAGQYADSSTIGIAVLKMLAEIKRRTVTQSDLDEMKVLSASMPVYPDVKPALIMLKNAGFRLVTLSNNPTKGVDVQLKNSGIRSYFASLHSIDDDVHRYKPARESYLSLASKLQVTPTDLLLVSCHAFDVLGAASVGCKTAMIRRPQNAVIALGPNPDFIGDNLMQFAKHVVV